METIGNPEAGNIIGNFDDRARTVARVAGTFTARPVSVVQMGQGSDATVGP